MFADLFFEPGDDDLGIGLGELLGFVRPVVRHHLRDAGEALFGVESDESRALLRRELRLPSEIIAEQGPQAPVARRHFEFRAELQ